MQMDVSEYEFTHTYTQAELLGYIETSSFKE